jgi:hypothetical protein
VYPREWKGFFNKKSKILSAALAILPFWRRNLALVAS